MLKIVFRIFDYDGDEKITLHDLLNLVNHDETEYIMPDFQVIQNILMSKKNPFSTEEESVETQWITHKDWKTFDVTKDKQSKIKEDWFSTFYYQLGKNWELQEMIMKAEGEEDDEDHNSKAKQAKIKWQIDAL